MGLSIHDLTPEQREQLFELNPEIAAEFAKEQGDKTQEEEDLFSLQVQLELTKVDLQLALAREARLLRAKEVVVPMPPPVYQQDNKTIVKWIVAVAIILLILALI